jgi:DNA modification methylase
METQVEDIKPHSPIRSLDRSFSDEQLSEEFDQELVASLVGMSPKHVRKVIGTRSKGPVSLEDVMLLLDQDSFSETFVPRSRVPKYLLERHSKQTGKIEIDGRHSFFEGDARDLIRRLPSSSIQSVVTSTPYWGLRLYDTHFSVDWADGEVCPLGHEQTPEGFIRHTTEILYHLKRVLKEEGSIWWNLMDTYNTRTQIRSNASETLNAMKGNDSRSWSDYDCRRYSAGHSYLKDGELCLIPNRVAERASRIGYWIKSMITWKKDGSLPEPVRTRATREGEYIIHLSLKRGPYFDKDAFHRLPTRLGGRFAEYEAEKMTDIWCFPTANGKDDHGAAFPLSLPGRCIGLTSKKDDIILDPFVGSGTTSLAAHKLGRRSIGFDVDGNYLDTARSRLNGAPMNLEL